MYQTVGLYEFRDAFQSRKDNFSYEGLEVLYNYLEDAGYTELDVIALCGEFTESIIKEALDCYDLDSIEELEANTTVLHVDDENIIYANY